MSKYSLETRTHSNDGDYSEEHYEFDTPEEVKNFIQNDMDEDESVHSVLEYEDGKTSNPRDVTKKFKK